MSNLRDWKRNPEKNRCQADGVYPGQFEPVCWTRGGKYSRLFFSYMYPCQSKEQARQSAEYYIEREFGACAVQFYSNYHLDQHKRFYALFIRRDK